MSVVVGLARPIRALALWGQERRIVEEAKSFNLTTPARRVAYWKAVDRQRQRWERSVTKLVKARFRQEAQVAVDGYRRHGLPGLEMGVRGEHARWMRLYHQMYQSVGSEFARSTYASVLGLKAFQVKAEGDWEERIRQYVEQHAGEKIDGIDETTLSALRDAIAEGIGDGDSLGDLADRIAEVYDEFEGARAITIARTEVIAASNAGSQEGARATGLDLDKEWIAVQDERTRDAHADADGDQVPLDQAFDVDGDQLMFPGDSSLGADPGNTINCRCTEGYVRSDRSRDEGDDTGGESDQSDGAGE